MSELDSKEIIQRSRRKQAGIALLVWLMLAIINTVVWVIWLGDKKGMFGQIFFFIGAIQLGAAIFSLVQAIRGGSAVFGVLSVLGGFIGFIAWVVGGIFGSGAGLGGAWGRPLRIRGRQLHPELREGSDWTEGDRPNPNGLDEPTRAALEALWLHDAQKEHASVPAFSRVSWLLAAVGAPADLLAWAHRAALEEISHTRICFALAAGYAGRSYTVEPMPELLLGGLGLTGTPLRTLTIESLTDGCQLEGFNADVAAACAHVCEEPVTKRVLEQIAREERSHADFSWAVIEWLLRRDPGTVSGTLDDALLSLQNYPRPTAVSDDKRALVAKADVAALRRHGRLQDAEWAEAWQVRLGETRRRVARLSAAAA